MTTTDDLDRALALVVESLVVSEQARYRLYRLAWWVRDGLADRADLSQHRVERSLSARVACKALVLWLIVAGRRSARSPCRSSWSGRPSAAFRRVGPDVPCLH